MTSRCFLLAALALAACTEPRQLVLSIGTNAGVPCDIDRVRIVATAGGTTTVEQELEGERLPVSVTLLDDTPDGSFDVHISGYKGNLEVMRLSGPLRFSGRKAVESVLLESRCTPDQDCQVADAMTATVVSPATAALACGANVTRYTTSDAVEGSTNACTVPGTHRLMGKDLATPRRLTELEPALMSSDFQFYGRPVRQIWMSKDGYLSFGEDNPDPTGEIRPGPLDRDIRHLGVPPPRQSVMAFWDTLALRPTGVCYEIDGDPGNQQLRVTWGQACLTTECTSDNLNFTVLLDEHSHRVAILYGMMSASNADGASGINATVGIVDDATGCPSDQCVLATGLCKDGKTPCGYSQVFSQQLQKDGLRSQQFIPVVDP
jgi:hypothetical protein